MPTIRQMYGGIYNLYKTQYANGQIFRSTASNPIKNTSSIWSNVSSTNTLTGLTSNYNSLMNTYNQTKNTFDSEFSETMTDLKNSAREVRNFDFNVGEDALTTVETFNEDGEKITSTKYNDKMTDALKTVEKFLSDYNDTINFFNDNSSVSNRVSRLATNFSDTTYFAKNYSEIGIVTAKDGTMKIDEEKLVDSITKNPNKVSRILGSLADRAENKILTANSMKENLFPSAKKMLGKDLSLASAYSGRGFLQMNSYSNIGSLLNMFW